MDTDLIGTLQEAKYSRLTKTEKKIFDYLEKKGTGTGTNMWVIGEHFKRCEDYNDALESLMAKGMVFGDLGLEEVWSTGIPIPAW